MFSKIKNTPLILSIVFFLLCATYTTASSSITNQRAIFGSCEVCTATGCDDAEGSQTGATSCTDNCEEGGDCDDCDLSGTACPGPEVPGEN